MLFRSAQREILRLSDIIEKMLTKSILLFEPGRIGEVESLKSMDKLADFLNRGIKLYLTKLSQKDMTPEQVQDIVQGTIAAALDMGDIVPVSGGPQVLEGFEQ